ncbi:hypothetical protein CISIN_1g046960mg [Citrus sinensis]|uniref:Uncharacterized protein n=1 Tax=Citrus sinensis TaxID=2711 RepID=A0A067GQS4_CITSI|nr:hypothetical protein CISIN_1g046960mg [Citrus sinensis]
MGASFLSTVPFMLPIVPPPSRSAFSTVATRCSAHAGAIRCHKIETQITVEAGFGRRDILKCIGATIGMEIISSSGSVEMARAADLIQRRQRSEFISNIKETLQTALKGNPDLIPSLLTLALNDAMTYDKVRTKPLRFKCLVDVIKFLYLLWRKEGNKLMSCWLSL